MPCSVNHLVSTKAKQDPEWSVEARSLALFDPLAAQLLALGSPTAESVPSLTAPQREERPPRQECAVDFLFLSFVVGADAAVPGPPPLHVSKQWLGDHRANFSLLSKP